MKVDAIERVSSSDLLELSSEAGGSPMNFGVILTLEAAPDLEYGALRDAFAECVRAVPRMRQRLAQAPFGGGRPYWFDDPEFDIEHHVRSVRCPAPGDERAQLDLAAGIFTTRLPRVRPLWSATYVTGLTGGRSALIVVLHHVLADGIGGLAVLTTLVDGAPSMAGDGSVRPRPVRWQLALDAFRNRLLLVPRLPHGLRLMRDASRELRLGTVPKAPKTSLNRPTGQRRRLVVARADLPMLRAMAHRYQGTVNDALLAAVGGALHQLLHDRREPLDRLAINMPVASRRTTTATRLGNELGVLSVEIVATGDPWSRLAGVVERTRQRKSEARGLSYALLAPVLRVLAGIGVLGWYMNRQHQVTTFVSNLRGPAEQLSFLGRRVTEAIPVGQTTGNVTVAFNALSYAGELVVTAVADEQSFPDIERLGVHLQHELDMLSSWHSGE